MDAAAFGRILYGFHNNLLLGPRLYKYVICMYVYYIYMYISVSLSMYVYVYSLICMYVNVYISHAQQNEQTVHDPCEALPGPPKYPQQWHHRMGSSKHQGP